MKQCPRCNRTYDDDTLTYCLEDGTILIGEYDPEDPQISPFPPSSNPPRAYGGLLGGRIFAPRQRSRLAIGAMLLAALVVGLLIGGFIIFQRYNSPSSDVSSTLPTPSSTTATTATPTAVSAIPTPTPMTTPSPRTRPTPVPELGCVLYNDDASKTMVNGRIDCDTRDCDNDPSTIAGEYHNGIPIRVVGPRVPSKKYTWTWIKVVLTDEGRTVWIADTKKRCK